VAIASGPNNINRNRFKDVLPYDDNRVKLTPTKDNPQGYINASHIRVSSFALRRNPGDHIVCSVEDCR
jgi:tyrosine-protein phosphatase non-receptor type 14/21